MGSAKLLIAASESDADMLYVSGMFVPDAFVVIGLPSGEDWQWHGLFSALEVDRARQESRLTHIHHAKEWAEKARSLGVKTSGLVAQAIAFLQAHDIRSVEVPGNFPLMHADIMREYGLELSARRGSLFPQRQIKTEDEVNELAKAESLTRQSMIQAENFLAACGVADHGQLLHPESGEGVYSRDVRRVIECWLIGEGAMPAHTIVACAAEGADPHCVGHGPIIANQPIIIDIFPRLLSSGYWGDMTRSYVKGSASPALKKMYQGVADAQQIGLDMLHAGQQAPLIHQAIQQHFERQGFHTGSQNGCQCGFFHGTGHGVGLEIHEAPRVSTQAHTLQAGEVVTIEPGLYYPELGGIRLEDLCLVTSSGHRNLTQHPCCFEID